MFKEALQTINYLHKKENLTPDDQILHYLIKSTCLNRLGQFENALNFSKKAYQEIQLLEKSIYSIDIYFEMAEALARLGKLDEGLDIIVKGENLLKEFIHELPKNITQRKSNLIYLRGFIYKEKGEWDLARKCTEQSLLLNNELNNKQEIARSLTQLGGIFSFGGEINRAIDCTKKSMEIEKNSFNSNNLLNFIYMGNSYLYLGDLDAALKYYQQGLVIAEKMDHKLYICMFNNNIGVVYHKKDELDLSEDFLNRSLENLEKIGKNYWQISCTLGELFEIAIDKNDIEAAGNYVEYLERIKNLEDTKNISVMYRVSKAVLLKMSLSYRNRVKAEEMLKQVVEEDIVNYEATVYAFLNLYDLLLSELRNTGDIQILEELQTYISQMLDLAEKNHSYSLMSETYLLQARLALSTLDIKKAGRFFTQAQQIAERWDLTQLAIKVSNEHEQLHSQLSRWENLKESDVPLTERLELARSDEQMESMLKKRSLLTIQIKEKTVTIHKERKVCLVCKGETLGFMYICKCGAIYCDNCAQALTNLENACWACNTPIDVSKPVKLYEENEEEIKFKEDISEKSKRKQLFKD